MVHSVERNHRLRPAPPRAPPPAEAPDRPGRRVCFANPLVTSDHAPAPHKAQRAVGCHTSALSVSPGCTELPTRLRRGGRVPSNEESPDSRVRFPSNEETPNRVRFPSYEETPNPPTPYRSGRSLPGPVGDDGTTRKYFSAGAKSGRVSHFIAVRVPRVDQRAANATPGTANADPSKQPGGQQRIHSGKRASTDTLSLRAGGAAAAGAGSTNSSLGQQRSLGWQG